jgi:AcrR family transcriptional regulator
MKSGMRLISRHLPAEERRAVIVEAVIALAAEQNPGEITTASIATKMNLTQGALFRHFPSKEAVWQAVIGWVADRLMARVEHAAGNVDTPLAALEAVFMTHIDFVVDHPGVPRMLFAELQRPKDSPLKHLVGNLMQRYRQRLANLIEAGKLQGEVSADVNTAAAATLFLGTIQGLVMQSLLAGDPNRMRRDARSVFAIYRRGLQEAR